MAITPFDQPAQSNFISTYSPVPFNELMQAGAMKAKQYESGLENLMQTYEDTNNLKYIPNSKDEEYIKSVVVPHTKQIVDKYSNQDLSDPIIRRQMRMELNNGIDKQRIKDIQNSFEGYKQYVGEKMKLQQKNMLSPLEGTPHQNWDTSTQGTFQHLPSEWSDPIKGLQDRYFQGLETQVLRDKRGNPISDPRGYYTSAITANRIGQETETNLDNALATPDGQRAVALYRHQYNIPNNVSDRDILRQAMLSAGHKFIQDKTEGSPYQEWMFKEKEDKNPIMGVEGLPIESVSTSKLDPTAFELKTRKTHGELPSISSIGVKLSDRSQDKPKTINYYDHSILDKQEVKDIVKNLPDVYKEVYNVVTSNPANVDKEKYKKAEETLFGKLKQVYQNVDEHLNKGSYVVAWTPKVRKEQTEYLLGTDNLKEIGAGLLPNRKYYDPSTHTTYHNSIDFYNDVVKSEIKKNENGKVSIAGNLHPDNPFTHPSVTNDPDFRKGSVMTFGSKTIIVSGPPSTTYDKMSTDTYNNMKYLKNTEIQDTDIPGLTELYDGKTYNFRHNGKLISSSPDFDEAYDQAYRYLKSNNK